MGSLPLSHFKIHAYPIKDKSFLCSHQLAVGLVRFLGLLIGVLKSTTPWSGVHKCRGFGHARGELFRVDPIPRDTSQQIFSGIVFAYSDPIQGGAERFVTRF